MSDVELDDDYDADNRAIIDAGGTVITCLAVVMLVSVLLCSLTLIVVVYG